MNLPASAACQLVPQATIFTSSKLRNSSSRNIHLIQKHFSGFLRNPAEHVSRTARGCSRISFSMKCLNPPFSAMIGSQVTCCTWRSIGLALKVDQLHALGRQHGHLAIAQEKHARGCAKESPECRWPRNIRSFAQPDTDRRPVARGHDFLRIPRESIASAYAPVIRLHGLEYRVFQRCARRQIFLDQVRDDFGIGLGDELVSLRGSAAASARVVLDDSVVHHHDFALAIAMRMRVLFGRTPVRGPARVADPVYAVERR